jgi:hypothetical protein
LRAALAALTQRQRAETNGLAGLRCPLRLTGAPEREIFVRLITTEGGSMQRLVFALAAGGFLLLAAATPASATSPQRETQSFPFSGSADCGTFNDDYQGTVTTRHTTFFDAHGEPTVRREKIQQRETDTNSETRKTIRVKGSYIVTINLRTDAVRVTGEVDMGIGKGANVIHDTGFIAFNGDGDLVKVAGPHTVFEGGNEPYCQALS